MRVIARKALRQFWERHPESEQPLRAWYARACKSDWRGPQDIKRAYGRASFLAGNRVVFKIKGNRFRLIVRVNYDFHVVDIRFVGTHDEYNRVDAVAV